jgi:drug/metabolite transporter (DMT)-like permease
MAAPGRRPADPSVGILLMVLAVSTFTCMDASSKYLSAYYPIPTIVWARYVLQFLLMAAALGPRYGMGLVRTANLRLQIIRGLILAVSSLVFLGGLSRMPLPEASSIAFMAPLIIAVLAGPVLHERVERRTWLGLAAGFAGVLLIVRPGGGLFTWVAVFPLASACLMAVYQLLTRKLAGRDPALTTLFYPAIVGTLVVPLAFPLSFMLPSEPLHLALFVAIGFMGALGHFFLIKAYEHGSASMLGPFMYSQLAMALFLGWAVFGHLPDGLSFAGMLVIAGSGLMLVLSHRRR